MPAPRRMTAGGVAQGLQRQWTRDLAWLLFSPNLLASRYFGDALAVPVATDAVSKVHDWMRACDVEPPPPGLDGRAPVPRLGLWAERLMNQYLIAGCGPRLTAANVTVREAGRTVGECDFLLHDAAGRALHWEMAVKFYLRIDGADPHSLAAYVGPGLSDRLDIKLDRLVRHQLRLVERAPPHALPDGPWHSQILLKGWLFERLGALQRPPDAIAPGHAQGFWGTRDDWAARGLDTVGDAFAVVPHAAWLSGLQGDAARGLDGAALDATLDRHFGASGAPLMIAALRRCDAGWREVRRGFIVPPEWPQAARAFLAARRAGTAS